MIKSLDQTLADNLNELMRTHQLSSNEKVAGATGLGTGTIQRTRRAESSATLKTIESLAQAFRISPSKLLTKNLGRSSVEHDPDTLSDQATRLVDVVRLLDAIGRYPEVLQAAELLLRQSLPAAEEAARGHPEMAAMLEQFTKDPASLTSESFALLRKQMQRVAGSSTNNNEQTRKKAGGSGA